MIETRASSLHPRRCSRRARRSCSRTGLREENRRRPAAGERTPSAGRATAGAPTSGRKVLYWYDPMAPGSKFDKPGKSPFMDMELVPKYADEAAGAGAGGVGGGRARSRRRRSARPASRPCRSAKAIAAPRDPRGRARSRSTRRGRRGSPRGSPGASRSSTPTSRDRRSARARRSTPSTAPSSSRRSASYLLALENRQRLSGGTPDAIRSADELVAASRDRLRLWGIGPGEIAALEQGPQPRALGRPSSLADHAAPSSRRRPSTASTSTEGQELYLLADLSTRVADGPGLRVRARPHFASARTAEATVSALPGQDVPRPGRLHRSGARSRDPLRARAHRAAEPARGAEARACSRDARLEIPARAVARRPEERPDRHGRPPGRLRRDLAEHVLGARREDRASPPATGSRCSRASRRASGSWRRPTSSSTRRRSSRAAPRSSQRARST